MKKQFVSAFCILACAAVIGGIAGKSFYDKRHFVEDIVPGEHVTESSWFWVPPTPMSRPAI